MRQAADRQAGTQQWRTLPPAHPLPVPLTCPDGCLAGVVLAELVLGLEQASVGRERRARHQIAEGGGVTWQCSRREEIDA